MSRILVVAPYPPRRCGIGAYAAAQVERMREEGDEVRVISPPDGDGDVRVPFDGGRPFRAAQRLGARDDRILVHFQPALYFRPRAPVSKVATSYALLRLCRTRPQTEILVHEADRPSRWRPDYVLLRQAFAAAPVLLFHTDTERRELERAYRVDVRARIVDHREGIPVRRRLSRADARRELGLPEDAPVFVCLGFLHPDKGYERAIDAVRRLPGASLHVLGEVKDRNERNLAYARRLREAAAGEDRIVIDERYLDEAELDVWTVAADAVVLPYRRSWSSGALARAQALGTPAVVTDVGGLADQASEHDVVVSGDEELLEALTRLGGARRAAQR